MDSSDWGKLLGKLIVGALLAIIPARMAKKRGRSVFGYYMFGLCAPFWVPIIVLSCLGKVKSLRDAEETGADAEEASNTVAPAEPAMANEPAALPAQHAALRCAYCEEEISAEDEVCPHCGAPIKNK